MQLPIDVKAVLDEATDIDEAARTPVSISLYIDASCTSDVLVLVQRAFETQAAHARVVQGALEDALRAPYGGDDAAVIVAGFDERVGEAAASLRAAGVPTMVVTTLPSLVSDIAHAHGHPIPMGDVVAAGGKPVPIAKRLAAGLRGKLIAGDVSFDADDEPIMLDEDATAQIHERMGSWIISACHDKRLAFALAFPFVRRPLSLEAVGATSMQNAGVGLVLILPGADMPVMTLNQAKMLLQIAAAYGRPMSVARVKELACVVGGAFACRTVARQLVGALPGLGWAIKAAIGYVGTEAMGRAAIEYFEAGGSIAGLSDVIGKAREAVVQGADMAQAVAVSVAAASSDAVDAAEGVACREGSRVSKKEVHA